MIIHNVLLILLTGILSGFLNVLAGGGSLIAMPTLIFLGLPSAVANGTNRIALMIQNLVAIGNFKRKGFSNFKFGIFLAIPAVIGSIIGANFAVDLSEKIFNNVLAVVMVIILILVLFEPHKKIMKDIGDELSLKRKIVAFIAFFFVGIYGGFIQGGVGFVIIFFLSLISNMSLVRINSIKVFVVSIYLFSSLIVFIKNGMVNWSLGLILGIGNALGAWLGSNLAIAKGDKWIKVVFTAAILLMSAKLFGLF